MADLYQIGLSGIYSSQAQLSTTGNNIANISTEGYSRQTVEIATATSDSYGSYFLGNGSIINGIERAYDKFAFTENILNTSQLGYSTEVYSQTSQMDMLLSDESTSMTTPVLSMFETLNGIADYPNMLESRTVFLESASSMVSQYNRLYENLEIQYTSINNDIVNTAKSITSLAESIADLNVQISTVMTTGAESNANDLLDQRDQAIQELSQYVDVSIVDNDNGMQNVYIGSGQSLVIGATSLDMVAINGEPDPSRKELSFSIDGNTSSLNGQNLGGKMSAMFDTREDVERAFNQLGQNAIGLTHSINEQQKEGMTLDGDIGQDLFNDVNSQEAMESRVLAHDDGFGSADLTVRIDDLAALTADEFELVVDEYTPVSAGVNGSLSFIATNRTTGESQTISIPNLSLSERVEIPEAGISIGIGSIDSLQVGKTFSLRPTRLGANEATLQHQDPEKIAAASLEIKTVANESNTGSAVLRVSEIVDSTDSLYMDADNPLTIKVTGFSATNDIEYDVLDKNDNIVFASTAIVDSFTGKATFEFAGVKVEMISGFPEVDPGLPIVYDQFTLEYNETGEGDNSNILAMADLQTQKLMSDGKATFSDVYNNMLAEIGAKAANAEVAMDSDTILQTQSMERVQSITGVNMDEEAANLLKFQQYYSAAARVISVATEIFDTILSASR